MFTTIIVSILSSGIVTVLLIFLFQQLSKSSITHYFDKKIKEYEHDLNLKSEQAKFDYQRKIQDFNLYTTNKHKSYIDLYEQLLKAYSYVTNLTGFINVPTFEEYNNTDILKYLQNKKLPEGKIHDIVSLWDTDKELAKKEIFKYDRLHDITFAKNNLENAQNIFWKSQLYFSTVVADNAKLIIDKLWDIQIFEETSFYNQTNEGQKEIGNIRKELPNLLDKLINDMKTELSIGYYKEA